MSNYSFLPMAKYRDQNSFKTWINEFNVEEINHIRNYCDSLPLQTAVIGTDNNTTVNNNIRESEISWIGLNHQSKWFYDRLAYVGRRLNADFYGFDLYGFVEDIQYTVYDGNRQGHYSWHVDMSEREITRKLTLVMQLSDPSEYEGGDIEIYFGGDTTHKVEKKLGLIVAFPGWVLHRVSPVTSGTRKTLVVWIGGPEFK